MGSRKITELVLPFERVFVVPGLQSNWKKGGLIYVPPNGSEEMRLIAPPYWRVVIHDLTITPLDPLTYQFGSVDFLVHSSTYRPDYSIVASIPPTEGVLQFEHPTKILVPESRTFAIQFRNASPVFFANYEARMELFTERVAN